ncbi:MAG: hypothetical protein JO246_14695, partial [Frankiaceae bacterium]|nr:hypothetical protein [Frankiaceae bacterium]
MPDIVLATGRDMPHGPAAEDPVLVAALAALGITAAIEPWGTAASFDARLVVVRTTWDYTEHVTEFLGWVDETARRTTLINPAEVIRWNLHKSYLLDLAYGSVPIMPTALITHESPPSDLAAALEEYDGEVVIKPAVSVGAYDTMRVVAGSAAAAEHLRRLVAQGDALVQPFEPSIIDGETSLVYFDGDFSHAIRKVPAAGDYRV